jgi:hypothetical protein
MAVELARSVMATTPAMRLRRPALRGLQIYFYSMSLPRALEMLRAQIESAMPSGLISSSITKAHPKIASRFQLEGFSSLWVN